MALEWLKPLQILKTAKGWEQYPHAPYTNSQTFGEWWSAGEYPPWLIYDLGANYEVRKVRRYCGALTCEHWRNYALYVSADGVSWGYPVLSERNNWFTTNAWTERDVIPKVGRYIRVIIWETDGEDGKTCTRAFQFAGISKGVVTRETLEQAIDYPLFFLSKILADIRGFFLGLQERADEIPIIGGWVAGGFGAIAEGFHWARIHVDEFRLAQMDLVDLVASVTSEFDLKQALSKIIPDFELLISDPAAWVVERIISIYDGFLDLLQAPRTWVDDKITELFADWHDFISDPKSFVADRFEEVVPGAIDFLLTPYVKVWNWIIREFPHVEFLFSTPYDWFTGILDDLWVDSIRIRADPVGWVEEIVEILWSDWNDVRSDAENYVTDKMISFFESRYESIHDRFYKLSEHILRYMWEGKW